MKKNTNIDDFFKEQLGSFEVSPSPEVWDAIKAKLKEEKEDRKVIPLWWKVGGVAALLAILLTVSGVFQSKEIPNNAPIVEETIPKTEKDPLIKSDALILKDTEKKTGDIVSENKDPKKENGIDISETINSNKLKNNAENSVTTAKKYQANEPLTKEASVIKNATVNDGVAVSSTSKTKQKISNEVIKEERWDDKIASKKEISNAVAKVEKTNSDKLNGEKSPSEKEEKTTIIPSLSEDAVAKEENVEKVEKDLPSENKKSIFDAIEEDKESIAKKEDEKSNSYWEITPNVGPVFYNSINGGSSISPAFADNAQSGNTNISYGVQVSYAISDKLSVRTGINNVNVGYTTGDVTLAIAPTEVALKSINYTTEGKTVLTAFDKGAIEMLPTDPTNPFSQVTQKSSSGNAEITQSITYYEVPMELKYTLINKRFGVNMIGGFSTLFLGNNEISVSDGDFRSTLGEANNLNTMSFSTNIGLGFDYKISKRFKFNIEPIFKYQLNPYTSTVDFNPYYFGIYSGLSFKF
ncbi:MAG: outer membrane beta-barrel protein [Flavobacteriaceae bacterium]